MHGTNWHVFAAAGAVKCQAQQGQQLAKKAAAAAASLPALLAASPAFALVRATLCKWGFTIRGMCGPGMAEQYPWQDSSAQMPQQAVAVECAVAADVMSLLVDSNPSWATVPP
jgi:hypothetical protein